MGLNLFFSFVFESSQMSLKQKIYADHIDAFKAKDQPKKAILSVVKGEIQTIEKNTGVADLSDEDALKIIQKTAKSLRETIDASGDEESRIQLEIVNEYLPKQMGRDEIEAEIRRLRVVEASGDQLNIGAVMKHFGKLNVDRKLVAEVFNSIKA